MSASGEATAAADRPTVWPARRFVRTFTEALGGYVADSEQIGEEAAATIELPLVAPAR